MPLPAQIITMGVDDISEILGRRKYGWAGRIEALKMSPTCRVARKLEARPRVGDSSSGASVENSDHVMVQEEGEFRDEEEIEYCLG